MGILLLPPTRNNVITNHRHKRSIGTAFAIGIPVIGVASIAVKSLIDSIMLPEYFASKQDMLINAQRIEELRLGHNDISKAVHEVNNRLASIGAKFDLVIASTAIATMESDLKSLIQYLETALQITLLKYEAALAAAQNSRTSPYTLTQSELIKLVSETSVTEGKKIITLTPGMHNIQPAVQMWPAEAFRRDPLHGPRTIFLYFTVRPAELCGAWPHCNMKGKYIS